MINRLKSFVTSFYIAIILIFLSGMVVVNLSYIKLHPVETKFLTPWLGMRTFLEIGTDPYGEPATQRTQLLYYGDIAEPGQDPLQLSQPFLSEILYFPLALINDYITSRVIWMILLELLLIGSAFLILELFKWKLPVFIKALFIITTVAGAQAILPLLENGQAIFIFFMLLGGLLGLQKELDELSGAAFALAFLQPSVTGIACLMIFWWVIKNRRWRVVWGGLMVWGFLMITSFGLFPGWLLPFIRAFKSELVFMNYQSTYFSLANLWPAIGTKIAFVLTMGIISILILEWRLAMHKDFNWLLWVISLTLAVNPLVGIPTLKFNEIFLFLPFILILKTILDRGLTKNHNVILGIFIMLTFLGGWAVSYGLHYHVDPLAKNIVLQFVPSFILITGLYWIRWWATHPPRTWMDNLHGDIVN